MKLHLDFILIIIVLAAIVTTIFLYFEIKQEGSKCLINPIRYVEDKTSSICTCKGKNFFDTKFDVVNLSEIK